MPEGEESAWEKERRRRQIGKRQTWVRCPHSSPQNRSYRSSASPPRQSRPRHRQSPQCASGSCLVRSRTWRSRSSSCPSSSLLHNHQLPCSSVHNPPPSPAHWAYILRTLPPRTSSPMIIHPAVCIMRLPRSSALTAPGCDDVMMPDGERSGGERAAAEV